MACPHYQSARQPHQRRSEHHGPTTRLCRGRNRRTAGQKRRDLRLPGQIRLPDGRRSYTAKTEREARKWLREARDAAARGNLAAKQPPTFGSYLSDWLTGTQDKVKTRTFVTYRLNVSRVLDTLAGLRLDELKPRHFQTFYNDLAQTHAPRTVRQVQ